MRVRDQFKCDRVVNMGDEVDLRSFSTRWPLDPDAPNAGSELELAVESLEDYYKEFQHVELCESNHGIRIFKKAFASGLPRAVIRRYEEIFKHPKGWHYNDEGLTIDGVLYIHGDGFNQGSWRLAHQKLKQSVVIGHLHSGAGVVYSNTRKGRQFAFNSGALINPKHAAFAYGKHFIEKPVLGCGVVIDGEEAYFIPMPEKLANKC